MFDDASGHAASFERQRRSRVYYIPAGTSHILATRRVDGESIQSPTLFK
jgi:hypothetical protein